MKKTLLAVSITALFATSAQAATVYTQDNVAVDVYGDIEVMFKNDKKKSDSDKVIRLDDADFGIKAGYGIGNGLTLGGVVEFSGEEGTAQLGDTYVSVSSTEWGTLSAGKHATIYDDAGIGSDYTFGFTSFYEQEKKSGDQVIKYKFDNGMVYGGVAYLMSTAANTNTNESAIDGKLGVRVADFDFTAFYGQADVTSTTKTVGGKQVPNTAAGEPTHNVSNYTLEARYTLGDLALAATVAGTDDDSKSDKGTSYGATATYQLDKAKFAAGWANIETAGTKNKAQNDYYINAGYAFNANVNVYAEIGATDADNTELGYATGMQITF